MIWISIIFLFLAIYYQMKNENDIPKKENSLLKNKGMIVSS